MVVVFDVNETLLDVGALQPRFAAAFGDRAAEARRLWFARLLHASTVATMTGLWHDFATLARASLDTVAAQMGIAVDAARTEAIVGGFAELPPHADVAPALDALAAAGVPLAALTNSTQAAVDAQLAVAGLGGRFRRILSVDAVRRFKPHPAVYAHAAAALGTRPADLVMVAAHDWDCAGALACGWRAAFVARPGTTYSAALPAPTWRVDDLHALTATLLDDGP